MPWLSLTTMTAWSHLGRQNKFTWCFFSFCFHGKSSPFGNETLPCELPVLLLLFVSCKTLLCQWSSKTTGSNSAQGARKQSLVLVPRLPPIVSWWHRGARDVLTVMPQEFPSHLNELPKCHKTTSVSTFLEMKQVSVTLITIRCWKALGQGRQAEGRRLLIPRSTELFLKVEAKGQWRLQTPKWDGGQKSRWARNIP